MVTNMKSEIDQLKAQKNTQPTYNTAPLVQTPDQSTDSTSLPASTGGSVVQVVAGSSYTRWGKHSCPDGTELIYKGKNKDL